MPIGDDTGFQGDFLAVSIGSAGVSRDVCKSLRHLVSKTCTLPLEILPAAMQF